MGNPFQTIGNAITQSATGAAKAVQQAAPRPIQQAAPPEPYSEHGGQPSPLASSPTFNAFVGAKAAAEPQAEPWSEHGADREFRGKAPAAPAPPQWSAFGGGQAAQFVGRMSQASVAQPGLNALSALSDALDARRSSAANPFAEPQKKDDARNDFAAPNVTPEIRNMAQPGYAFHPDIANPRYIDGLSRSDPTLASQLAGRYLEEYNLGRTPEPSLDDLSMLTSHAIKTASPSKETDFARGLRQFAQDPLTPLGGIFNLLAGPVKTIGQEIGHTIIGGGFQAFPKTINPATLTTDTVDKADLRNIDLGKLPDYYRAKAGLSPLQPVLGFSADSPLRKYIPDLPDIPGKATGDMDAVYSNIASRYKAMDDSLRHYAKAWTFSDLTNTLLSAPGVRTSYYKGEPAQLGEANVFGTGSVAGLTSNFARTQFIQNVENNGVKIDDADVESLPNGWSVDQTKRYDEQLRARGTSLAKILMGGGLTWPDLDRSLQTQGLDPQARADVARSLGYTVTNERDEPMFEKVYTVGVTPVYRDTGSQHVFSVSNPDKLTTYADIEKADVPGMSGAQLADTVGTQHAYQWSASVKTVPFQDLVGMIALDPFNFGKLQMVYAPLGEALKLGTKAIGVVGKGAIKGGALLADMGVGSVKTANNLFGFARGLESEVFKPEQFTTVRNVIDNLTKETSTSVAGKLSNRLFYATRSILHPDIAQDGNRFVDWVNDTLPKLQGSSANGKWADLVPHSSPGTAEKAARAMNEAGLQLRMIAGDEEAWGSFAKSMTVGMKQLIDKPALDDLRALAEKGDYAGTMKWLTNNKLTAIQEAGKMEMGQAANFLDANDVVNHLTNAYQNGVRTLTDNLMGTKALPLSPTAARVNSVLSSMSRQWIGMVLGARPGWNVINYMDNSMRLALNGFNPTANVQEYERTMKSLGVTAPEIVEMVYGGNPYDEAVKLFVPRHEASIDAGRLANTLSVRSTPDDIARVQGALSNAIQGLGELPPDARPIADRLTGNLSVELDKLVKGQGSIADVRKAAVSLQNIGKNVYGHGVGLEDAVFKSKLQTLREWTDILTNGDKNVWERWMDLGQQVHSDIEAAARMRALAPTYINKYHDALSKIRVPTFPEFMGAQIGDRFAGMAPQDKAEAVRTTLEQYEELTHRLNGMVNEAAIDPSKIRDAKQYIASLGIDADASSSNFVHSMMPRLDGHMIPAADPLIRKTIDWMRNPFRGMTPEELLDPAKMRQAVDEAWQNAKAHLGIETAEATNMSRIDQVLQPTTNTPNSIIYALQDGQVAHPANLQQVYDRMDGVQQLVAQHNQGFANEYAELNHEPWLNQLDEAHRALPADVRAHRYDMMRQSFADQYGGAAKLGDEDVQIVGGVGRTKEGVVQVQLSDGRIVDAKSLAIPNGRRAWYYDKYQRWENTKPAGKFILTRSGISDSSLDASGNVVRRPVLKPTGEATFVPPDVARAYSDRMTQDIVKNGGQLPTSWTDSDGVVHALAYDKPEDFIARFKSGSGLGVHEARGGGANAIDGMQRTADNMAYLARVRQTTDLADLEGMVTVGTGPQRMTLAQYARPGETAQETMDRLFNERGQKVSITRRIGNGTNTLTNNPAEKKTISDVTNDIWQQNARGVYTETRGQWVPVFDANQPPGTRITFQRPTTPLPPMERGTRIPDEIVRPMQAAAEAAEPVEQKMMQIEQELPRVQNTVRARPERMPFTPDAKLNGEDVQLGPMRRMQGGGYGVEVRNAAGEKKVVTAGELEYRAKPGEPTPSEMVRGTPEQVAAEAGVKTPEQQAAVEAMTPKAPELTFLQKYPKIQDREDLVAKMGILRDAGLVNISDEQVNGMADLLDSFDSANGLPKDFSIKNITLTDVAPSEGLYQRVNLDTPEFKRFFEGSKTTGDMAVSDIAKQSARPGEPMVLYHGTPTPGFTEFEKSRFGATASDIPGVWITENPEVASKYAARRADQVGGAYPLYASIKNPLDLDKVYSGAELDNLLTDISYKTGVDRDQLQSYLPADRARGAEIYQSVFMNSGRDHMVARDALQKAGFDGATSLDGYANPQPGQDALHRVFIAFDPGQVKSAIANVGSWDINNPNILYQGEQGKVLGAFKLLFGEGTPVGVVHLGQGATVDTVRHEFTHAILAMAQLPEKFFDDPVLVKTLSKQTRILAEAAGAPRLQNIMRGEGAYNYILPQELYKVDHAVWDKLGPEKTAAFKAESVAAEERLNEMFRVYLEKGYAPTRGLKGVFKKWQQWLSGLVQHKEAQGVQIPVEVKKVFDQWLAKNPEWDLQLSRKGQYLLGKSPMATERMATLNKFTANLGNLADEWQKAVENLPVAYGGWNDSPLVDEFNDTVKTALRKIRRWTNPGETEIVSKADPRLAQAEEIQSRLLDADRVLNDPKYVVKPQVVWKAGDETAHSTDFPRQLLKNLGDHLETQLYEPSELDDVKDILHNVGTNWDKYSKTEQANIMDALSKKVGEPDRTGWQRWLKEGQSGVETKAASLETLKAQAQVVYDQALKDAGALGIPIPKKGNPLVAIEKYVTSLIPEEDVSESASKIMQPVLDKYRELLEDGKWTPKHLVDGKWEYYEDFEPTTVAGRMKNYKPNSIDAILAQERGEPMSLEELAALNAPETTYVSPALAQVMQYHQGVHKYMDDWHQNMVDALDKGYLPGNSLGGVTDQDAELANQWVNSMYQRNGQAAALAWDQAKAHTLSVMMPFETTTNMDILMQHGPALPSWTGKFAGIKPLMVGGIVPFWKFPKLNIESWMNTLGNHPAILRNMATYGDERNVAAKQVGTMQYGGLQSTIGAWPIKVGDQTMTINPFTMISLGQIMRPFGAYDNPDNPEFDKAMNLAASAGFGMGPTLRLMIGMLIPGERRPMAIVPALSMLPTQALDRMTPQLKQTLGLTSNLDSVLISKRLVYNALADMQQVSTPGAKNDILNSAIYALQNPDSQRWKDAEDGYRNDNWESSTLGYFTGLYPKQYAQGQGIANQIYDNRAQLTAAMSAAGLTDEQMRRVNSAIASDPQTRANSLIGLINKADPQDVASGTYIESIGDKAANRGQVDQYYKEVAKVEAEFQQQFGFSGNPVPEADRKSYYAKLAALKDKYSDALNSRPPSNYVQTDKEKQADMALTWQQYLHETKPVYTNGKYDDWQKAVAQWENDLPKIAESMWSTLSGAVKRAGVNMGTLPPYLKAVSDKASMDKFDMRYDTVENAIYKVLRDHYYGGYYDAVSGKVGPARLLDDMTYRQQNSAPDYKQVSGWINQVYGDRFSESEIARSLGMHPVADITQHLTSNMSLVDQQAWQLGDALSHIPPGREYYKFLASLPTDVQKHLQTFQDYGYKALPDPVKWKTTFDTVMSAIGKNYPTPSIEMVKDWVQANRENDALKAERERLSPGIGKLLTEYGALPAGSIQRRQFSQQHPVIAQYYKWLDKWAPDHPSWSQYYGSDATKQKSASAGYGVASYSAGTSAIGLKLASEREKIFPGIGAILRQYGAIPKTDRAARAGFLGKNPIIKEYYGWLDNTFAPQNPGFRSYQGQYTTRRTYRSKGRSYSRSTTSPSYAPAYPGGPPGTSIFSRYGFTYVRPPQFQPGYGGASRRPQYFRGRYQPFY